MNFKERIKSLKISRLIVEAILVFSSVYFALILEADRNMDYERGKFIIELEQAKESMKIDTFYYGGVFSEKLGGYRPRFKRLKVAIDSMDNLNYEIVLKEVYDFQFLHPGIETPIPQSLLIIENSYMDLIQDTGRFKQVRNLLRTFNRLHEFEKQIIELQNDFWYNKATEYKIRGDYYQGPDLKDFVHSQVFRFYVVKMDWLLGNYFRFGDVLLNDYPKHEKLLVDEIEFQKEAMRGIF